MNIRFPTVTVCQDEDTPSDPMAPIARFLMPLRYDCGPGMLLTLDGPDNCTQETWPLRKRFKFLFESTFHLIEKAVDYIYDSGSEREKIPPKLLANVEKKARLVDTLLSINLTTPTTLRIGIKRSFSLASSKSYFAVLEKGAADAQQVALNVEPSLESKKIAALVTFALRDIRSFGHFLTEVLPLIEGGPFSRANRFLKNIAVFYTMHELFSNLTSSLGPDYLGKNVSMFELPDRVSLKSAKSLKFFTHSEMPYYTVNNPKEPIFSNICLTAMVAYLKERHLGDIQHPCEQENTTVERESCCENKDVLSGSGGLYTIMKVMRWARHRGQDMAFLGTVEDAASSLGYAYYKMSEGPMAVDAKTLPFGKDPFAMIPVYEFGYEGKQLGNHFHQFRTVPPEPARFQPTISDNGLCQGFNSPDISQLYHKSDFFSIFFKAFNRDFVEGNTLFEAQPFGQDFGLDFLLDKQLMFRNFWNESRYHKNGGFKISFAEPFSSHAIRSKLRPVHVGYHVTFLLTPLVLSSDKSLKSLPVHSRNCLFPDEVPEEMILLKAYSQGGCIFECMARYAREVCKCIPWDVPRENGTEIPTCNRYGYFCFDYVMKNTSYESMHCGYCLPDCNVVEYQVSETSAPLNADVLCQRIEVT